jgi:hypothetical protein
MLCFWYGALGVVWNYLVVPDLRALVGLGMPTAYVLGLLTSLICAAVLLIFRATAIARGFVNYYVIILIAVALCASLISVLDSQVPRVCSL